MENILIVAEKPIVAEAIAHILSDGKHTKREDDHERSIFEFYGKFEGKAAKFKVISTCGHIMGLHFPFKFGWGCDPEKLFTCHIYSKEEDRDWGMRKLLATESENASKLILFLDCDKEGESICFEVIDAVKKTMGGIDENDRNIRSIRKYNDFIKDKVFRAQFSAITETSIKRAMLNLVKPDRNKANSVLARQELDFRIGCAFSRYLTDSFFNKKKYILPSIENINDKPCSHEESPRQINKADTEKTMRKYISFGPCQTPTLAFCVNRHDEIEQFKRRLFWRIEIDITLPNGQTLKLQLAEDDNRQFDNNMALDIFLRLKRFKTARVIEVIEEEEVLKKPVALNTVELLKYASNKLHFSPEYAMQLAQKLYMHGHISYPRTETTAYPDKFDFMPILMKLAKDPDFDEVANQILTDGIVPPRRGEDKGDHEPITPMKDENPIFHILDEWQNARLLYQYIPKHFLATLMANCTYLSKKVTFLIGDEPLVARSRTVIEPGFTQILNTMALTNEKQIPNFNEGQIFEISAIRIVDGMTSPPEHLTESELINLMETHGIGTDASIPTHIKNICEREYVTVDEKKRQLIPTKLGIVVIHGFRKIDPDLVEPTIRSKLEKQLNLVAKGHKDHERLKEETLGNYLAKYRNFVKNYDRHMDSLFADSFNKSIPIGLNANNTATGSGATGTSIGFGGTNAAGRGRGGLINVGRGRGGFGSTTTNGSGAFGRTTDEQERGRFGEGRNAIGIGNGAFRGGRNATFGTGANTTALGFGFGVQRKNIFG